MNDTLLVRMKPYDPRRGFVLRRLTYAGIRFESQRGWYRVQKSVADHLRETRCVARDPYSPRAFDVCTEAEANTLDAAEADAAKVRRSATDDLKLMPARSSLTSEDLPKAAAGSSAQAPSKEEDAGQRRGKRERE